MIKIDQQKHSKLLQNMRIRGTPTVLSMKSQEVIDSFEGNVDEKRLGMFFAQLNSLIP